MDCNVIRDLIPLYIDSCCSEESAKIVKEHIETCSACKKNYENMKTPSNVAATTLPPAKLSRINDWRGSVLQSALLFVSFAVITVGVALEAATPSGIMNGYWAFSIVIPATGFLLSLTNWYFVRLYKSRKSFSNSSSLATLFFTAAAYIWAGFHYEFTFSVFQNVTVTGFFDVLYGLLFRFGIGIFLTMICCILSKVLSNKYGKMLGKE